MLTRVPAAARDDSGFSLVELLLVIVILGVITVPLANVFLGAMRQTDSVQIGRASCRERV